MFTLEIWSGIGVLAVAAAVLSPYWWPPIWYEMNLAYWRAFRFRKSVPTRWERARAHWRGVKADRRLFALLLSLTLLGGGWIMWTMRDGAPDPTQSKELQLLFYVIIMGTAACGFGALYYALETIVWVWEGFFGAKAAPSLPQANPMNRVGTAAPLGEARFATAREVDSALASRGGHFDTPKFRD